MSFKFNIISSVIVRFLSLFVSFGSTLLLARWLKPDGMGELTVFLALPMICISLAEMGIRQAIARLVGNKDESIDKIANNLLLIWIVTSMLGMFVVLSGYYFQGLFKYGWSFCVSAALILPFSLLLSYLSGIAMGIQKILIINYAEICSLITRLVSIMVLVIIYSMGLKGALLVNLFAYLLPASFLFIFLCKYLNISFVFKFDKRLIFKLVGNGFQYALALFVITLIYRMNILLLKRFVSESEIGYFSISIRLAEMIWLLPASVGMVVFSHSTSSGNQIDFSRKVVQIMRMNILLCSIGAVVLALICPFFVKLVFGGEYLPAVTPIRLMLPGIVVMVVFKILRVDIVGRGKPLFAFNVVLFTLFLNVILNLLLIPVYGINGTSIALSISYCAGAYFLVLAYSKETGISVRNVIFDFKKDKELFGYYLSRLKKKVDL